MADIDTGITLLLGERISFDPKLNVFTLDSSECFTEISVDEMTEMLSWYTKYQRNRIDEAVNNKS